MRFIIFPTYEIESMFVAMLVYMFVGIFLGMYTINSLTPLTDTNQIWDIN
jgi:hypothetical protein